MATPLCTVLLATYNRRETLMKCLDHIEAQDVGAENLQVVVIDDGSTDDTLAALAARDHGFGELVVLGQQNQGPGAARALGLPRVTGPVTLFVNDDTLLATTAIGAHLNVLAEHPRSMVLGRFDFAPEYANEPLMRMLTETPHLFSYPLVSDGDVLRADLAATCNMSVPSAVAKAASFDPRFTFNAEDVDFALRVQEQGYSLRYCASALAWHDHRLTVESVRSSSIVRGVGAARLALKNEIAPAIVNKVLKCLLEETSYLKMHDLAAATLERELESLPRPDAPISAEAYSALAQLYRIGNLLGCAKEPTMRHLALNQPALVPA